MGESCLARSEGSLSQRGSGNVSFYRVIQMLQFDPNWRFTSPGPLPPPAVHAFFDFIDKIASQGHAWTIVEKFKERFVGGTGRSSSLDWAWSDLDKQMGRAAENAPVFIESFYNCCMDCRALGLTVPPVDLINKMLAEHKAGYKISPPYLLATQDYTPIPVPEVTPSLASQARPQIDEALDNADRFLSEGRGRHAVSELLWLLESISTAFKGTGDGADTIQGKYFNAIVKEMKATSKGRAQEQILTWMTTLHGYLSNPTGGGVRHGADLQAGIAIQPHEARLYCNLIRSYITFLIEEHERQVSASGMEFGQPQPVWRS